MSGTKRAYVGKKSTREETTRVGEKKKRVFLGPLSNNEAKGDSTARVLALSHCSKP